LWGSYLDPTKERENPLQGVWGKKKEKKKRGKGECPKIKPKKNNLVQRDFFSYLPLTKRKALATYFRSARHEVYPERGGGRVDQEMRETGKAEKSKAYCRGYESTIARRTLSLENLLKHSGELSFQRTRSEIRGT